VLEFPVVKLLLAVGAPLPVNDVSAAAVLLQAEVLGVVLLLDVSTPSVFTTVSVYDDVADWGVV
jgi:hypothetical protein